jgi:hypothetical protein
MQTVELAVTRILKNLYRDQRQDAIKSYRPRKLDMLHSTSSSANKR